MKKIVFITPPEAEYGFRLTGLNHFSSTGEDIENILMTVTADAVTGLIIVDERLLNDIGEEKLKEIERSWKGVLVVMPSPEERGPETEDYAARLIKRAIGYHVRLQV